jgi:hypothetical protein
MLNKDMFNTLIYKGNSNQNSTEIPSHPIRMAIGKKHKKHTKAGKDVRGKRKS